MSPSLHMLPRVRIIENIKNATKTVENRKLVESENILKEVSVLNSTISDAHDMLTNRKD